ncbi:MAG: endopeptidase La [Verrucomicrobia bacterium]|nr:endopeptidase La [Verrucomicrobiota bacterium]MBU4290027.1 endopeptidase La [Verrucomicrobiota bacterium]MBU4430073.1 endopeptidase La [Verrucomicrobiota bacterium]MCG2679602.1 endopeptidase La [Kiritimatiellia bacterium]
MADDPQNKDPTRDAPALSGAPLEKKQIILARDMLPETLPIIPVENRPLFPKMILPLILDDERAKRVIADLVKTSSKFAGIVLMRPRPNRAGTDPITHRDLYSVGVVVEILRVTQPSPEAPIQVMVGVLERFSIEKMLTEEPVFRAKVRYIYETEMSGNEELKAYSVSIVNAIKELIQLNPMFKDELNLFLTRANLNDPGRLADFSSAMTMAGPAELQDILETISVRQRIEKALILLKKEVDVSRIQTKINQQIEGKLSKQQREYFLREQLKAIKKELGLAKEGKETEIDRFRERLKSLKLTPEASERINEEMEKMTLLDALSPEFTVTRNYLDWLTSLPWGVFTPDAYNIRRAERILNRDHYGLEDVKERIMEFLSVGILKGNVSGSIICFVGPPGVGKTSIGHSIAESIGRKFYRFSLGGMRDEAEIKGHRRTYIGAMPGKFIQAMKLCKSANPLIMLDEIDKIGMSFQGDPASALLEVLDPEQNRDFLDHYLDVRFDLSHVLFVCTANVLDTIPRPLLDRMEIIHLSGYILAEKMQIAKRYLIPKQLNNGGLKKGQVVITRQALKAMVDGYAREPGVRSLENAIKKICRKSARSILNRRRSGRITVAVRDVPRLLGKRLFSEEDPFRNPGPGVVMGLAWTSMGGDTIYIEATKVEAEKPGFKQTGQLGNVMVESSEIAYTFVRSFLSGNAGAKALFEHHFIHLHVPSGATPKDGPSAGITMACALYSLAVHKPVRAHWAMTGELTLTGLVMPVGGIKEKTIAAKRARVVHLVFPKENKKDFDELPAHIRRGLHPHFVGSFKELVPLCLL